MRSVGEKAKTCVPSWAPEVGAGVGELEKTVQPAGAVTVKVKEALRSG